MKNKMIKVSTKITAAMLVAATVIGTAVPTVYAAEPSAIEQDMLTTENEESANEEATPVETQESKSELTREALRMSWIYQELNEGFGEPEEVTPTATQESEYELTQEDLRMNWIYRELNEGFGEPEEVTPTEMPVNTSENKPQTKEIKISEPETYPFYGEVKRCYFEKGPQVAFCLFIYYCPSPLGYEVIEYIEQTIKKGDRGYTIDGVYYDCPENDPYFSGKEILFQNMQ